MAVKRVGLHFFDVSLLTACKPHPSLVPCMTLFGKPTGRPHASSLCASRGSSDHLKSGLRARTLTLATTTLKTKAAHPSICCSYSTWLGCLPSPKKVPILWLINIFKPSWYTYDIISLDIRINSGWGGAPLPRGNPKTVVTLKEGKQIREDLRSNRHAAWRASLEEAHGWLSDLRKED